MDAVRSRHHAGGKDCRRSGDVMADARRTGAAWTSRCWGRFGGPRHFRGGSGEAFLRRGCTVRDRRRRPRDGRRGSSIESGCFFSRRLKASSATATTNMGSEHQAAAPRLLWHFPMTPALPGAQRDGDGMTEDRRENMKIARSRTTRGQMVRNTWVLHPYGGG